MVFTESLLSSAVFARSIKVLRWQPGAPKFLEHDFPKKKRPSFLKFIEPVTPLWVLYPTEIKRVGFPEPALARAVFAKSIKVLGWQPGPPKSREHDFQKKKNLIFLNFIGPQTPPWVPYPAEIMHMGFTEPLLARAVFARSSKVLGRQPGAPKSRKHDFPKKNVLVFLKFIEPLTPLWVLQPSQIMHLVCTEFLLARAVFTKSIKVLGWQAGAPKSREPDFSKKKNVFIFNFIGPVTPPWVLYHSEIMHLGFTEFLLAGAVFTRSIKVPGWQPGAPKPREHDFPEKNVLVF